MIWCFALCEEESQKKSHFTESGNETDEKCAFYRLWGYKNAYEHNIFGTFVSYYLQHHVGTLSYLVAVRTSLYSETPVLRFFRDHLLSIIKLWDENCAIKKIRLSCNKNFDRPFEHCQCKYTVVHTGCNRRNGPDFGRVFLRSNYTDITQNTCIQSWTVTEIMAGEVWNFDSYYSFIDYQIHIETGRNMWFL